ncbi:MAG: peptide MFS transporter [Vicinamibacteria bacterium]|nr:peptide MFS transporter [Vicinamibacteria bacterium]
MSSPTSTAAADAGWAGHPRGLATLFLTEMWERFSYYGMRAFLILYMTAPAAAGGLGFAVTDAASIYGTYTGSVWGAAILGGLVADRFLGAYRSVLLGGVIIALGHVALAFTALTFFYLGLGLIVVGTGLLKPNISTLVGALYREGDGRRDAGFSVFYMGINLGAFLGPLVAGYIAQRIDWHLGFACAAVGMAFGLVQYVLGKRHLTPAIERLSARPTPATATGSPGSRQSLTSDEWTRIGAIVVFFLFAAIFWGAYEQAASTLSLFGDRYTRHEVFGFSFPSSWFQTVQPVAVILLAPIFAWLWLRLGRLEPSSPAKFAFGLAFVGIAFLMLIPAASMAQSGDGIRVSPWWLIAALFVTEFGELCVSPVGLSLVTKLSPVRLVGLMMGVWFLSNSAGNKLAGWSAGFFGSVPLTEIFGTVAAVTIGASVVMFLLVRPVRKMMGGVL